MFPTSLGLLRLPTICLTPNFVHFLKDGNLLDWPFNFWKADDNCCMNAKLEKFNNIGSKVSVILISSTKPRNKKQLWVDIPCSEEGSVVQSSDSDETATPSDDADDGAILPPPPGSTHICPVSGDVIQLDFQSTLLEPQILDKYLDKAEKFRKKMALICLEDHVWTLRSHDINGLAIV